MPTYYTESFSQAPLPAVVPAYVYVQYNDDPYVTAFFTAYNELAQGYLNWFNQTPLAVWTSPSVSGSLLDWTGTNLYNTPRPVISSESSSSSGAMATDPMATQAMASFILNTSGTAQSASDDLYKRVLTWVLYRGDGKQATIEWLRRRIARFLYGTNGSDIDVGLITNVSVSDQGTETVGAYGTYAYGTQAYGTITQETYTSGGILFITIPNLTVSQAFIALFKGGFLPAPFQMTYNFTIA